MYVKYAFGQKEVSTWRNCLIGTLVPSNSTPESVRLDGVNGLLVSNTPAADGPGATLGAVGASNWLDTDETISGIERR